MKLDIQIDPNFTGTLQDSPSHQGTTRLDGVCHLEIDKPMKTKGLMVQLIGILKIDVRRGITLKADVSDGKCLSILTTFHSHLLLIAHVP